MKTHYSEEEKKHVCTICGYRLNDTLITSSYNTGIHNEKFKFTLKSRYFSLISSIFPIQHKNILNLSNYSEILFYFLTEHFQISA